MITSIDSSILIDVGTLDGEFGDRSQAALRVARREGRLVVCPVVWAEVSALYKTPSEFESILDEAGINFDPFDRECSSEAGRLWSAYRQAGGKRGRLLADFLVGTHALIRADGLLTRDRGFDRRYFKSLRIIEP